MARLWQRIIRGERGQALPIVLALLVLGGLLIVPSLNYASTSLYAGQTVKKNVRGVYAADAGIEYTLRRIKNFDPLPEQLPENVNQMQVTIQAENLGPYTLAYYDEILDISTVHYEWISVEGAMVEAGENCEYTITVTRLPACDGNIKLEEVGVRLPDGYEYDPDSADLFGDNLSPGEPDDTLTDAGAHMLSWELPPPRPELSPGEPVATQTFYFTGEGDLVGDYTWVKAQRDDIGAVGEVTGILYRIIATATRPGDGEVTAVVRADVIHDDGTGETRIILWQINPQ